MAATDTKPKADSQSIICLFDGGGNGAYVVAR